MPVTDPPFALIAGPCAVESREQTLLTAEAVAAAGPPCSAAAPTSRARAPTPSRGWAARGSRSSPMPARARACRSSPSSPTSGSSTTFERAYRFTLDLSAVPILKERTHLPVMVDPSHAPGRRALVRPLSLAAVAAGADGLLVEVHPDPAAALCDGPQALHTAEFAEYAAAVRTVHAATHALARPAEPAPAVA
jgi:3-deoxy-D-arabino-heptulosonate 7-phosphate (DAHP) synthase